MMVCGEFWRRFYLFFFLSLVSMLACANLLSTAQNSHLGATQQKAKLPRIEGNTGWTDEGLNTLVSDPSYRDPVSGELGLHRFLMSNPCLQRKLPKASDSCAELRVLVLFVDFSDRRAEDADVQFRDFQTYLDFLAPAAQWLQQSSYGKLQLRFVAPQQDNKLDWIRLSRAAADYVLNREDHLRFAYVREIAQTAYDRYQIRVDDYDTVLIMPVKGKAGLPNGPATISARYVGESRFPDELAYVDQQGKAHGVDHFITAGNDMFRWGALWFVHELGHLLGLPDTYLYQTKLRGQEVDRFFYVGGWDLMGNIGGHSPDFFAWHKLKLNWIDPQQVRTVAAPDRQVTYQLSPVEQADGLKLIVIPTGLRRAYVVELRSGEGVNAMAPATTSDHASIIDTARRGVLIYRIDAGTWLSTETPVLQVISRAYYHRAEVAVGQNQTGLWRAIDASSDGQLGGALWQEGDVFEDQKMGVRIRIVQVNSTPKYPLAPSAQIAVSLSKHLPVTQKPSLKILRACFQNGNELHLRLNRSPRNMVTVVGDGTEGPKSVSQEIPLTRVLASDVVLMQGIGRKLVKLDAERAIESIHLQDKTLRLRLSSEALTKAALRVSIRETKYFSATEAVKVQACR